MKIQTKSLADRITTSLSLAHQRKNKQASKQTKTQHKSHPIQSLLKPLNQPLGEETKRKKEFNHEAWEKETTNTVSLKKKMGRRSQDGGGVGRGDHFLFYKFIERTTER